MTVAEVAKALGASVAGGIEGASEAVRGGYVSDLLSDVMAHAQDGDVWVTLQKHVNIIAVARLKNIAGIVLVNDRQPDADTLARAVEQHVPVIVSPYSAFDAAGRLYELGLRGRRAS